MAIRTNPELTAILASAPSRFDQVRALNAALTADKRVKAKRVADAATPQADVWAAGVLFRDAALSGPFTLQGEEITGYGVTSDLTTCLAADLSTGKSVLRIEGGGHWLEGTFGLVGSGADFTFPTNPTATNSIAISGALRLRGSSTLPALPNEPLKRPHYWVFEDWTSGVGVVTKTVYFDSPQAPIVWQDAQLSAAVPSVPYTQCSQSVLHGDGGYRCEFGLHLFDLPASCNDEVDAPVYQVLVAMTPDRATRWGSFPAMADYNIATDSTFIRPCKIKVYCRDDTLWHTFEMQRDGLPLNHPSMKQSRTSVDRWRPFVNVAQQLYHCSHRLKLAPHARALYGGTRSDYWMRPRQGKERIHSNGTIPVFGSGSQQINGYLHLLAMPEWAANSSLEDWNADPKTDPYFPWTTANDPSGSPDSGARYPTHATGWRYEYGAANTGHDFRHGPGGQRFDRLPVPSQLAYFLTDPDGSRIQGGVPWRTIWDEYAKGYFNLAYHHVRNARTMEMLPFSEVAYGQWGHFEGYYNPSGGTPSEPQKWIRLHGMGTNQVWRSTDFDRDGFHQYNGYITDNQHAYQCPGWMTTHFGSPAHAISQKLRYYAMVMSWNKYFADPSANFVSLNGGTAEPPILFRRHHSWRWEQMLFVWKTAADHPQLVSRAEIEEIWRLHLESLYDNLVVPATTPSHPQYNHFYFQGIRNLGASLVEVTSGGNHYYSTSDDDKTFYFSGVLALMKTFGCFDRLRQINSKCAAALDMMVQCMGKFGPERMVATKGRQQYGQVTPSVPTGTALTVPAGWAAVAATMQPQDNSDMVRNADGSVYIGPSPDWVRERWQYQHLMQQCCYIMRDQFASYQIPYTAQAANMAEEFEQVVAADMAGTGNGAGRDYRFRYVAAGPMLTA